MEDSDLTVRGSRARDEGDWEMDRLCCQPSSTRQESSYTGIGGVLSWSWASAYRGSWKVVVKEEAVVGLRQHKAGRRRGEEAK